jgi:hypothetical protein
VKEFKCKPINRLFTTGTINVNDIQCVTKFDEKRGRSVCTGLVFGEDGPTVAPSERFWTSLAARFGFSQSIFSLFEHEEVFQRISDRHTGGVRFTLETAPTEKGEERTTALAVCKPDAVATDPNEILSLARENGGERISYGDGLFNSWHKPVSGGGFELVGPDLFGNRFVASVPFDGYGKASAYLAFIRQICTNGAVMMTKMFRTEIKAGNELLFALKKCYEGFDNDEGFAAARQRLLAAQVTPASAYECNELYLRLIKAFNQRLFTNGGMLHEGDDERNLPVFSRYHELTGELSGRLGLADVSAASRRTLSAMPSAASVYDMFNFATELSTHHMAPSGSALINQWIGNLFAGEDGFDLEGAETMTPSTAKDFYLVRPSSLIESN